MKTKNKTNIIEDQELFFNQNSANDKFYDQNNIFIKYANKEQVSGFVWLSDKKIILDYGCGTGNSINLFFNKRKPNSYSFYGVDIAEKAIEKIRKKYPKFKFYKISNNKIPQIKNNTMKGAYLLNVLHHTDDHEKIFREIYSKIDKNGKFFIDDLSSNNLINKLGRNAFTHLPRFIKNKFDDDLVVGESIPEKYKVDIKDVIKQLEKVGFTVEKIGYGHLFFFVFGWIDRFVPFSKIVIFNLLYLQLIKFEQYLLTFTFFQNRSEVFYIYAVKK